MKINYKKSLKFLTMFISAALIATVSAQVYTYMYVDGTISIGAAKMVWLGGADFPADGTINGGTVTMDLDVQPGASQNFSECLFLKNQDAADHNLTLSVTTEVSTDTFEFYHIYIYKNSTGSWESVDTLDGTVLNDQYSSYTANTPLIAGGFYRMTFEVKAKTGTSGTSNFDMQVTYE